MYEMSVGEDGLIYKVRCWSNMVPGASAGEKPDSRPPSAAGELATRSQNSRRKPKSGRGVELIGGGPARERGTTVRAATPPACEPGRTKACSLGLPLCVCNDPSAGSPKKTLL